MGSKIPNGNIQLVINARDPDTTDLISRIDIITNGGVILDSLTNINSNNVTWQKDIITGSFDNKYFYARVIENDGDYVVCSAIWTRRELCIEEPLTTSLSPNHFALENNYPNPFKTQTAIRYSLPAQAKVSLKIYDISGKIIRNLVDEDKSSGVYTAHWNGRDDKGNVVSAGVYFYRLETGKFTAIKKLLIVD